jgi:serine phosphatase RsbU (regulator of sigma subunit)
MPGYEYESATVTLEIGDTFTVYTDGVTDAMSPSGEMFGAEGVDRCLAPPSDLPASHRPKPTGERLIHAVRRHANGRPQNDDIAVVCFGRIDPNHRVGPEAPRTAPLTDPD